MNILVISSNLIGDTILSTGIINYFMENYKNSKFTFIIGPSSAQIYENFPRLHKIIIVKKQRFNLHWIQIWKNCFFKKWDIIIDFRSSALSYTLFHKKKFIFRHNNNTHKIKQLSNFFKIKGIAYPIIHNNKNEISKVNQAIVSSNKYIVISPGGNWTPKIWPVKKFNELIVTLNKKHNNLIFIIVGSKNEKLKYFYEVIKNIDNNSFIDLMGMKLTLTFAYIKKSNLFVGNDSGLMHLSVASKIPTIALFGPTDDKIYAPFNNNGHTLRTNESYDYFKNQKLDKNKSYMCSIKVNNVVDLIESEELL